MKVQVDTYNGLVDGHFSLFPILGFEWSGEWSMFEVHIGIFFWAATIKLKGAA